jgi:hypothetical protein
MAQVRPDNLNLLATTVKAADALTMRLAMLRPERVSGGAFIWKEGDTTTHRFVGFADTAEENARYEVSATRIANIAGAYLTPEKIRRMTSMFGHGIVCRIEVAGQRINAIVLSDAASKRYLVAAFACGCHLGGVPIEELEVLGRKNVYWGSLKLTLPYIEKFQEQPPVC